ncbi:hypothetical protein MIR68_010802 [Amoeboaphelidium protococcarum]|nr:hypothetical protein MIR68_010802 [Amoeboaphelidium protococcarum]
MNVQEQIDESKAAIAAIQQEINIAQQKVEEASLRLKQAIEEGQPADVRAAPRCILESATAQLTSLYKKQDRLMEKKIVLLSKPASISNEALDFSIASYDSCRSRAKSSGICASGRHVKRLKNSMKKMRQALLRRDKCCVATGEQNHINLTAAHIVPLNQSQRIPLEQLYSPQNGILLRKDLGESYDLFQWMFEADGRVIVLYEHWIYRNSIKQLTLSSDPATRPSAELIQIHNELARSRKADCCPDCWKLVGSSNIEYHLKEACEYLAFKDDESIGSTDDDNDDEDDEQ